MKNKMKRTSYMKKGWIVNLVKYGSLSFYRHTPNMNSEDCNSVVSLIFI